MASKVKLKDTSSIEAYAKKLEETRKASIKAKSEMEAIKKSESRAEKEKKRWEDSVKNSRGLWGLDADGKLDTKNVHAHHVGGLAEAAAQSGGKAYDNFKSAHQELTHLLMQLSYAINADVTELTQKPIPGLAGTSAGGLVAYGALAATAAPLLIGGGVLAAAAAVPAAPFALFAYLAKGKNKAYWQFNEDQFKDMKVEDGKVTFGDTGFSGDLDTTAKEAGEALIDAYLKSNKYTKNADGTYKNETGANLKQDDLKGFESFCQGLGVQWSKESLLHIEPSVSPASSSKP